MSDLGILVLGSRRLGAFRWGLRQGLRLVVLAEVVPSLGAVGGAGLESWARSRQPYSGCPSIEPVPSGGRPAVGLERGGDRSAGPGDGPRAPRCARRVP